jgi:glycerol-3-phosphate dehydrogenase
MDRSAALTALRQTPDVSVLIVGAGINGIGTFRDLALNGVDVLLIDRSDFSSGASAASSHMAHGGIRYLENGEFRLVHEAVQERNRLIQNAPHLVRPLPTTIPIFKRFSGLFNAPLKFLGLLDRPSERGSVVIKLGLMLYDAYTGADRVVPRHRFLDRRASLARWSRLNPAVVHTATYYDGAILDPERLAVEVLLDAEAAGSHARALNYVEINRGTDGQLSLRDQLTGAEYRVRPRIIVNATGSWIDHTNRILGQETHFIGGTKGSHLVLNHPGLRSAIGDHEFFFEHKDGRIVLIFPLHDRVLIGTSDIATDNPEGDPCTEDEVDYFLGMISRVFPSLQVDRQHIVYRFTGVRPLAAGDYKRTGQISRDHEIRVISAGPADLPFPILSLVGGKWTSFRAFSEQVTDRILDFLQLRRRSDTRGLPIGGGRGFPASPELRYHFVASLAAAYDLAPARVQTLFERYGTRSSDVARFISLEPDSSFSALAGYSRREIGFVALHEKVIHLDDLLLRRSMLAMLGRLSRPAVDEAASALAHQLHWDAGRVQSETARFLEIMRVRHDVAL